MRMPTRQSRADWLERWSKEISGTMLEEIKIELVRRFNDMKKEIAA
ncbi:MAG: hypothetical protein ACYC0M_15710 [Burkholderiales bacterium]